jgi:chromosomal replication initiation ATPase DnaA
MQDNLWQAVLGEIELSVSRASFVTWFKNTRLLRYKDEVLVIGVPNVFIKQQLESKYSQLVIDTLGNNGVKPDRVEYKIHSMIKVSSRKNDDDVVILSSQRGHESLPRQTGPNTYLPARIKRALYFRKLYSRIRQRACLRRLPGHSPGTRYKIQSFVCIRRGWYRKNPSCSSRGECTSKQQS